MAFIFDLIDGAPGSNRYGADPRGCQGYGNTEVLNHHHDVEK
ncbi:hypothetical protein [Caulobacter endophyticus]|nr:hypothetical protein [Caulobacter endophyticus]MDG2527380.1 hypothetical protein [Caulobacter endophyticus]